MVGYAFVRPFPLLETWVNTGQRDGKLFVGVGHLLLGVFRVFARELSSEANFLAKKFSIKYDPLSNCQVPLCLF